MKRHQDRRIVLLLSLGGLLFTLSSGLFAADVYVKKATWPETMVATRAKLLDAQSRQEPDNFGHWFTTGPLESKEFKQVFFPEKGIDLGARDSRGKPLWQEKPQWTVGQRHNLPTTSRATTYLVRTIEVSKATSMPVGFGSDDGLEVWLNGKKLVSVDKGVSDNGEERNLKLKAGKNHLLLKIYNSGGGHHFFFATGDKKRQPTEIWRKIEKDFPVPNKWMRRHLGDAKYLQWFANADSDKFEKELLGRAIRDLAGDSGSFKQKLKQLTKQKTSTSDPQWLALYEEAIAFRHRPPELRKVSTRALRMAIEDLIKTYGSRYRGGQEYLKRMNDLERRITGIETAIALGDKDARGQLPGLMEQARRLQEEALLANPLLDFDKLLFIRRHGNIGLPRNWQGNCALGRGGYDNEIAVLSPVKPGGKITTLFKPKDSRFVGDVDLHFDGDRMLFSMRNDKSRFQIYEIGADGRNLRQVTQAEPDIDNYDACYLPNGKIIFGSTAVFAGVPCVGGGSQVANLYIMDSNGENLRQLCFDQEHDWCPTVMNDGRVMFARWEYSDTPHYFTRLVFQMNPDGTGQKALYGSNSLWPNSTFYARSIPGHPSKFVGIISGHHGVARMGEMIIFDPAVGEQEADGVVQRIPGYGQEVEPRIVDGLVNGSWPKFLHPYPLSENYFLVSAQLDNRSPWGIYLVDVFDNMVPILIEPGLAMLEPLPLRKTARPPVIADRVDLKKKNAVVYLDDVYRGGGLKGIPRGTVKSLRLFAFDYGYQGLASHTYVGIEGPWDIHRILGTVPVEKDGSSVFNIPANTPVAVQPLDKEGRALQLMRSWFVGMPGEKVSCIGCHERNSDLAQASRSTVASQRPPHEITPWYGPARGFSFKREVQPVLDTHCVSCHDGEAHEEFKAVSDLSSGTASSDKHSKDKRSRKARGFSKAYTVLQKHVRRPGPESDYHMMPPGEYHASTSPLVQMLARGHHGVKLDRESWERLYTWIDLNVPFHGTWSEFRDIPRNQRERRAELRQRYAGVEVDYEVIPELPARTIRPIAYQYKKKPRNTTKVSCPGWPFDVTDARRRQGKDAQRKIIIGTDNGQPVELTFVRIPAGEFVMGDASGFEDEQPCRVKIEEPYWISSTTITNQQFNLFDPSHDSRYLDRGGKDHSNRGTPLNKPGQPVVRVSWRQAMAYCQWLSSKTRKKFSLPTEAQWEFASRAGSDKANGQGWGISRIPDSVAEWTHSAFLPYPYRANDGRENESATGQKVIRGGSMLNVDRNRQSTLRQSYAAWQVVYNVGFRIICEGEPVSVETTDSVTRR